MPDLRLPSVRVLIAAAVVAGMSAVFSLVLGDFEFGRRPWQSFDVVLVPADAPGVVAQLEERGETVLSRENATVWIEDFSGGDLVTVAELYQRFDERDPRLDPFVARLPQLFAVTTAQGAYHVLYLDRRDSLLLRWLDLRDSMGNTPFLLAGWRPVLPATAALTALVALLPAVVLLRRRRWLTVLITVLSTAFAAAHGAFLMVPAVAVALAVAHGQSAGFDREREVFLFSSGEKWVHRFLLRTGGPAGVMAVTGVLIVVLVSPPGRRGMAVVAFALLVVTLLALWVVATTLHYRRLQGREHRLFAPVPLLRRPGSLPGLAGSVAAVVVGVAALVVVQGRLPRDLTIPVPHHQAVFSADVPGAEEIPELLSGLRGVSPKADPLSTAGYVAHRWYQSTLMFGGAYELPPLNETIDLQRLRREPQGLVAWTQEVERFDHEWVARQFSPPQGSVYRLFVREQGAFRIVWEGGDRIIREQTDRLVGPSEPPSRLPYRGLLGTVGTAPRSE